MSNHNQHSIVNTPLKPRTGSPPRIFLVRDPPLPIITYRFRWLQSALPSCRTTFISHHHNFGLYNSHWSDDLFLSTHYGYIYTSEHPCFNHHFALNRTIGCQSAVKFSSHRRKLTRWRNAKSAWLKLEHHISLVKNRLWRSKVLTAEVPTRIFSLCEDQFWSELHHSRKRRKKKLHWVKVRNPFLVFKACYEGKVSPGSDRRNCTRQRAYIWKRSIPSSRPISEMVFAVASLLHLPMEHRDALLNEPPLYFWSPDRLINPMSTCLESTVSARSGAKFGCSIVNVTLCIMQSGLIIAPFALDGPVLQGIISVTFSHQSDQYCMNSFMRQDVYSVGAFLGTVARWLLWDSHFVCCSAQSTWWQTLFRFYLDACWKCSEQHFSLTTALRLKHIVSSLSFLVQKTGSKYGYFCIHIENEKRHFRQAVLCKRSDSDWCMTGKTDPGGRFFLKIIESNKSHMEATIIYAFVL